MTGTSYTFMSPFAVTPQVLAPLAVLGLLFPALVVGLFALLRRWWLVLNVGIVNSALYTACVIFAGVPRRSWWARGPYLWGAMALLCPGAARWSTLSSWRTAAAVR